VEEPFHLYPGDFDDDDIPDLDHHRSAAYALMQLVAAEAQIETVILEADKSGVRMGQTVALPSETLGSYFAQLAGKNTESLKRLIDIVRNYRELVDAEIGKKEEGVIMIKYDPNPDVHSIRNLMRSGSIAEETAKLVRAALAYNEECD
jgi:hypothetical protein